MVSRAGTEEGFGLIELMIAMTIMTVAILAIVAGLSAASVSVNRASHVGTAATLADKQMEAYRALQYASIVLNTGLVTTAEANSVYNLDSAYLVHTNGGDVPTDSTCSSGTVTCQPLQASVTGPGGGTYRIDTYIVWSCGLGSLRTSTYNGTTFSQASPGCTDTSTPPVVQARPEKQVTVVVRSAATPSVTYFRETTTFDQAI